MGRPSEATVDDVKLPMKGSSAKNLIAQRSGKRLVFEIGFLCQIVAFVTLFIAFASPYWIISWPRVHSGFKVNIMFLIHVIMKYTNKHL